MTFDEGGPPREDRSVATATKLTYEDYVRMPDDGQRYELIDGELFVVPAPGTPHQFVSGNIYFALTTYVRTNNIGIVAFAPVDVIFSNENVVQPDLIFVRSEHSALLERRGIFGAPDLVIEILSGNRRRDEVTKRALYERFGVPEYWIVDPDAKTVKLLRLTGSRYETITELCDGDTLTSSMFPGFELSLATIFA
jgi:Uma2 family endonuclease